MSKLPLHGLTVLEFGSGLSGPLAGLRLADLGARVIKIEDPRRPDPLRSRYYNGLRAGSDSLLFHTVNRNKEFVAAAMDTEPGRGQIHRLIKTADVLLHNYPTPEMEDAGLGYDSLQAINPRLVYACIGTAGGEQDILVQALSGLAWTTGDDSDPPMPFGLPITENLCGAQLVQGILAALIRRRHTGLGACVQTSLLESALDFQFELLTTYYSSRQLPRRSTVNSGHALLSAPYGIYHTADGYIAIAMMNIQHLAAAIECPGLSAFTQDEAFSRRDEMKHILALHFATRPSAHWLARLHAGDLWAMEVLDWKTMSSGEAYQLLHMEQPITIDGKTFITTRCPIRIDGQLLINKPEPRHPEPVEGPPPNGADHHAAQPITEALSAATPPLGGARGGEYGQNEGCCRDLLVLDFSQFLSGPSASLRLADLGARVIKIERPGTGDICRQLYVSDTKIEGESTIFHAINRNKQSYAADLKNKEDLAKIKQLIAKADVMMHNFRPGVMERIGLDHAAVKKINPRIVYAEVTGYGSDGPWKDLPGQDLLLQSVSGLAWLSNNDGRRPTPMGVAVVDILAGTHVAQGILAGLYRRGATGEGALVQVSMLESILDFQSDVLTCFLNDGQLPRRGALSNAHAWLPAPHGIYKTADGYIALSTGSIPLLGAQLNSPALQALADEKDWFDRRDEIKRLVANRLSAQTTAHWLRRLSAAGIGCAEVMDYARLSELPVYQALGMELEVKTSNGLTITTTRCPIRIDGVLPGSAKGAPLLGEHNELIEQQFDLKEKALSP